MYSNILIPISLDEDRDPQTAIDVATILRAESGTMTFLHVIERPPNYALSYLPPEFLKEQRGMIESEMSLMASKHPGATAAVIAGHAGRVISDWSKDHSADCIVITSHSPGMQDLLLGSTAQYVVRHAACSVHVVR
ncbi:MAG: universal stress protein [Pseudomonadota bacterium]